LRPADVMGPSRAGAWGASAPCASKSATEAACEAPYAASDAAAANTTASSARLNRSLDTAFDYSPRC
jgi:hypothetical protein